MMGFFVLTGQSMLVKKLGTIDVKTQKRCNFQIDGQL